VPPVAVEVGLVQEPPFTEPEHKVIMAETTLVAQLTPILAVAAVEQVV
jgi:hypothetical protein